MSIVLILLDIISTLQVLNGESAEITIPTQLGDIKGLNVSNLANVYTFKGIQYVENQPLGSYRFKQSQLKTSAYIAPYDAINFGPVCPRHSASTPNGIVSEECLSLNIFTNNISSNANLPVLVYIHGGGFNGESSSDPFLGYNNPPFVYSAHDIVYVSIQYRLGAFGFLPLEEIKAESDGATNGGLNGINDQIIALQWIKQYISDFGGDPNQVTIWGISAGSQSICHLLVSPKAVNLFKNAILGSGACFAVAGSQQLSESDGFKYALQQLETEHIFNTSLAALRALSYQDLQDAYISKRTIDGDTFNKIQSIDSKTKITIDGYVLTETTVELFKKQPLIINAQNVILGFTNQESLLTQPFFATNNIFPRTINEYDAYIDAYIDDDDHIDAIDDVYYPLSSYPSFLPLPPPDFLGFPPWPEISGITSKWSTMQGDCCENCGILRTATVFQKQLNDIQNSNAKIYVYNIRGASPFYTYHGSDIGFLFNNPPPNGDGLPVFAFLNGIAYDSDISSLMQSSWINFVVNDEPGNNWSQFGQNANVMLFENQNSRIVTNYVDTFRNGACDYWIEQIGWDTINDVCEQSLGFVSIDDESSSDESISGESIDLF